LKASPPIFISIIAPSNFSKIIYESEKINLGDTHWQVNSMRKESRNKVCGCIKIRLLNKFVSSFLIIQNRNHSAHVRFTRITLNSILIPQVQFIFPPSPQPFPFYNLYWDIENYCLIFRFSKVGQNYFLSIIPHTHKKSTFFPHPNTPSGRNQILIESLDEYNMWKAASSNFYHCKLDITSLSQTFVFTPPTVAAYYHKMTLHVVYSYLWWVYADII
jgi:hypothetical protein